MGIDEARELQDQRDYDDMWDYQEPLEDED